MPTDEPDWDQLNDEQVETGEGTDETLAGPVDDEPW